MTPNGLMLLCGLCGGQPLKKSTIMCCQNEDRTMRFILTQSGKECRTITGLLTGHTYSKKLVADSDECRKCMRLEAQKTLEHPLCFCLALSRTIMKYLGATHFDKLNDVTKLWHQELLRFAYFYDESNKKKRSMRITQSASENISRFDFKIILISSLVRLSYLGCPHPTLVKDTFRPPWANRDAIFETLYVPSLILEMKPIRRFDERSKS